MKLLLIIFLITPLLAVSQSSDFIILKKNNKNRATFFKGNEITLQVKSGAVIKANISNINNDTIYLLEYIIQTSQSRYGFYYLDTLGSYYYAYHYSDIKNVFLNKDKKFNFSSSGVNLMTGSVLLTLGNLVGLAGKNKSTRPWFFATSAGLGGLGYLIYKSARKPATIGKKYRLEYMRTR